MTRALTTAALVVVSVLILGSGLRSAAGPVGPVTFVSMTTSPRPPSWGTDLGAASLRDATVAPPLGLVATIPLRENPGVPVFDPVNGDVYLVNLDGNVSILNGSTLIGNLSLSNPATSITIDPENGFLYVMGVIPYSVDRAVVEVVSDGRQIATISTDVSPSGLFDPWNGHVYVANYNVTNPDGQYGLVTVLDGTSVLTSITVGAQASLLAYDGQTGDVYVASGGENVTVLNGTSVVGTVSLGMAPEDAIYDAENGDVYFEGNSPSISVVQGTSVVGSVTYSLNPREEGLGPVDPRTGDLFVNLITNVSVVSGTSVLATLPIFRVSNVQEFEEEAIYDSVRGVVAVIDSEETEGGGQPDEVQLFNGTEAVGNLSLGVNGVSSGAVYDAASGDTYVITGPGCLPASCDATQKAGYVVILGSPSVPTQNLGTSNGAFALVGGALAGFAVAAVALVFWIHRRLSSPR